MNGLHHDRRGSGPTLVFVHGVGGSGELWDDVVERLADRYCCVTVDLLGFGRSDPLPEGRWSVADWATSLRGFVEALPAGPVVLLGHSLGGMVVQELLAADPTGVRAAVLCNTIPSATDQVRQINTSLAEMASARGSAGLAGAMAPGLLGPATLESSVTARARTEAIMAASEADSLARALLAICDFDAVDRLPSIGLPVLVVAGEHEGNVQDQARLAGGLPAASLVVIEGAGHMAPMEAPSYFAALVREFLDRSTTEVTA